GSSCMTITWPSSRKEPKEHDEGGSLMNLLKAMAAATVALAFAWQLGASADHAASLERLKNRDNSVSVNFKDADVSSILQVVAKAGEFSLTLDKSFQDSRITISERKTTIKELLIHLAEQRGLSYSVPRPEELVVMGSVGR